MYSSLCTQYTLSKAAILDLSQEKDFEELVQDLLRANWGLNWEGWWRLVQWNMKVRVNVQRRDVLEKRMGEKEVNGVGVMQVGEEKGDNKMGEKEERDIVQRILEDWIEREEVLKLVELRAGVIAFREYLEGKK